MVWLWIQSLVLIALTFAGGLWLGGVIARATTTAVVKPSAPEDTIPAPEEPDIVYPTYHGFQEIAEPVPVAAPPPPPVPARVRTALLFPVNQFGIVTTTQAPLL